MKHEKEGSRICQQLYIKRGNFTIFSLAGPKPFSNMANFLSFPQPSSKSWNLEYPNLCKFWPKALWKPILGLRQNYWSIKYISSSLNFLKILPKRTVRLQISTKRTTTSVPFNMSISFEVSVWPLKSLKFRISQSKLRKLPAQLNFRLSYLQKF